MSYEKQVLTYLEKQGYCARTKFEQMFSQYSHQLLRNKGLVKSVILGNNFCHSKDMRKKGVITNRVHPAEIIKHQFLNRSFVYVNRTGLVRLFFDAIQKPATPRAWGATTKYLKRFLTNAEVMAVQFHLGRRKWEESQRRRNMQIDGIVLPIRRHI